MKPKVSLQLIVIFGTLFMVILSCGQFEVGIIPPTPTSKAQTIDGSDGTSKTPQEAKPENPKVEKTPEGTNWLTYTADGCGFQIQHPPDAAPPEECRKGKYHYIGKQVEFYVGEENIRWIACQEESLGDGCPRIESVVETEIGGKEASRLEGYIGSIGGNIPQRYVTYIFEQGNDFYIFTLWALPKGAEIENLETTWLIRDQDLEFFERMLESLVFNN
jgi:hypothetical protein